jgi:hypothetical protein
MTDIDRERERIDELAHHIEDAKEKARDLLESHATSSGGPRSTDGDEPGEQEDVTPGQET